ncbi:MAG: DUF1893 domain-containing protein [Thermoproteota archaeon]|nr:DUF1893 domain-containing protein [Thermoproteota archaeon]
MQDLEIAKTKLKEREFTLVFVKQGKILFETKSPSMSGFLQAIERLGERLTESSVADKVVGRAAALLCVYSRIAAVFAMVMSRDGREVLEKYNVRYQFEKLVPNILDTQRAGICPFEKFASTIVNPGQAYQKLKSFADHQSSLNSVCLAH